MKLIIRKLLPFLLLLIINAYQVNVILFTHVHYLNGIPVTHSHPNHGHHNHSDDGLCFIVQLSSFYSLKAENYFNLDSLVRKVINVLEPINKISLVQGVHLKIPSLRGPPFL